MDEVILSEADGEGYAVPDIAEVEIPFDALNDTIAQEVTGVESLTDAQRYMEGLLIANGTLRATSVTGNESFFSKVGSGARAVYDWIKKMIKSIWDFFFKRDAPKAAAEAKEELKDAAAAAASAAEGGSTPAQTAKILAGQVRALEHLKADPHANKAVLDEIWKQTEQARHAPEPEKKKLVVDIAKHLAKIEGAHGHLQTQVDKIIRTIEHLLQYAEHQGNDASHSESHRATVNDLLGEEFTKPTREHLAKIKQIKVVSDPHEARKLLGEMLLMTKEAEEAVTAMRGMESEMSAEVKKAEAAIAPNAPAEAKQQLEDVRKLVSFAARVAKLFESVYDQTISIGRSYKHTFGG